MKGESEIVRLARPVEDNDHALGAQAAPATLVEYGDYECSFCRQLHPVIREIMNRTEGLRFVYRHFPISKVHMHAARAAEAAEAAGAQGRFWEMHDLLFAQDKPLDDERLARLAGKARLDMQRYTEEMAAGVYAGKVKNDYRAALYGSVTGTPTLYLNGARLGDLHADTLFTAVIRAGATLRQNDGGWAGWLNRLRKLRVGMTRLRQ